MGDQPINRGEAANRADQIRMGVLSLVLVAIAGYLAFRLDLLKAFKPENSNLFWLSIVWFSLSAMETFNKRMGQIEVRGEAPPYAEYAGLHVPLLIGRYGLLAYLLYLDWRWALTLYVLTLLLAVSPILENIGKALMFLWLKKRIDEGEDIDRRTFVAADGKMASGDSGVKLTDIRSIIAAFGKTLELESARPGLYAPLSSLPAPPKTVARAIISEYTSVAASGAQQPYLAQLQKAYLALNQFIPDDLAMAANDEWGSLEDPEISRMNEAISAHSENEIWLKALWEAEVDQEPA